VTEAGWFVARGTGVMALILLSVVVVLGVGSRSGRPAFGLPRFAVSLVHRNAALLAIGLLVVHIVTLLYDPYAKLRVYDLFIPFSAEYRPLYMGLGTLASDVMLILVVTSLLRRHIGIRLWRVLHWLAYASWPAAFGHSIGTGTDSGEVWMLAVAAGCLLAVLAALGWRVVLWLRPRPRPRKADDSAAQRVRARDTTTGDIGVRPARDWSYDATAEATGSYAAAGVAASYDAGPVAASYDAGPVAAGRGAAPRGYGYGAADEASRPADRYDTGAELSRSQPTRYATSPSLLDMYRKPGSGYQPASDGAVDQTAPPEPAGLSRPAEQPTYAEAGYPVEQPTYAEAGYPAEQSYYGGQSAYGGWSPGDGQPGYEESRPPQGGQSGYGDWSPQAGSAYQAAAQPVEPRWLEDDDRYQPAAEYVAMYSGDGYQAEAYQADTYQRVDPADSYQPPAYPPHAHGAPVAEADDPPWSDRGDYRHIGDANGYREDPQAVSSGWRR
jgi:methionine sulfoxide reductase heme-binding subunit